MFEFIRYRILMLKLRGEIAATIRRQAENGATAAHESVSHTSHMKPTCKACGSIV